ncbi:MAG: universal stress protein [Candidatus Methanosuratincola sp.]
MEIKKILVPVDGSPVTVKVIDWACHFAKKFSSELILLHVVSIPPVSDVGGIQVAAKELEEAGQSILNSAVKAAEERSVSPTALLDFSVGNAGMRIVQIAKEKSADIIVIGARGQSRIRALLMGSVANSVVNNAPCPVFVVRTSADQDASVS